MSIGKLVIGPMKAGKSTELNSDIKECNRKHIVIKPSVDTRAKNILTHDGKTIECVTINVSSGIFSDMITSLESVIKDVEVVFVDEFQFFPSQLINYIVHDKRVWNLYGLTVDYKNKMFPTTISAVRNAPFHLIKVLGGECEVCKNAKSTHNFLCHADYSNNSDNVKIDDKSGKNSYLSICYSCYSRMRQEGK